jgi:hypothetical protein
MPMLYSSESLKREEAMIKRGIKLYEELLEINLVRQLKIAEADCEEASANNE